MEYLTRLLIHATHNKDYRYHPLCKWLKLVNLSFADDLILFCNGSLRSIQILHDGFTKFSQDSGLLANLSKSHIYFGGITSEEKKIILDCDNIEEGSFPLKYLGVPLRPTKWKVEDCIRIYWMSIFLLSQSVIHEIDRLCRNFLRGAKGNRSKLHLSSWDQWIDDLYLKGQSFWEYNLKADVSWYWRKLTKLKDFLSLDDLEASVLKGKLNVSILYNQLLQQDKISFAKVVWCRFFVLKHIFILWQLVHGHLLTWDNLMLCHVQMASTLCPVCESAVETHAHLFFYCIFSQKVMQRIRSWLGSAIWPTKFSDWLFWKDGRPKGILQRIAATTLAAAVYYIWLNRSSCIFYHFTLSVQKIDFLIKSCLKARMFSIVRQKIQVQEKLMFEFIQNL
ncbi:uncharacterized protein LOC133823775 [Humulus lupulus]|uniref:uncharacterized protein LOC133823775 n=1 Tax=Humulus lupulus TaxID=3486 RepID=UPI002B40AD3C|nr:uncharacterized protein LOC133823775 [Humulus lupulus]